MADAAYVFLPAGGLFSFFLWLTTADSVEYVRERAADRPARRSRDSWVGVCDSTINQDRPSVCRAYEVGGRLCQEAREQAGLTV